MKIFHSLSNNTFPKIPTSHFLSYVMFIYRTKNHPKVIVGSLTFI